MSGINEFLGELDDNAKRDLDTKTKVVDYLNFPKIDTLSLEKREWVRLRDVVAVVADLKNSTKLDFKQRADTSARLYHAMIGSCARIMARFEPNFVDIQGDGLFGLFHGTRAFQRALCAGITLKTFGQRTVGPATKDKMDDTFPKTGLKVGMHAGIIVVKRVGLRGANEPVWAGRPVNWATKCSSEAEANQLVLTQSVYGKFEDNHYVTHSCGCDGEGNPRKISNLWNDIKVEALPDSTVPCKVLTAPWCKVHGDEFCQAVLAGKKDRPDV